MSVLVYTDSPLGMCVIATTCSVCSNSLISSHVNKAKESMENGAYRFNKATVIFELRRKAFKVFTIGLEM